MFDFVGKNKRLLQFFLAIIIVPTFAFFGIQSYEGFFGAGADVAEVAGEPITRQEFERALEQQRNRLREAFGGNIDPAMFDSPEARHELLDSLVSRRVLLDYAFKRRMLAGDEQIRDFIASHPAFRDEGGQFSRERYEALLRAQSMSPAGFEAQLRTDLALDQLTTSLTQSAFVSRTMAQRFARERAETREVVRTLINAGEHADKVEVSSEEIDAYYAENPKEFETPEQVRAAFVILDREEIAADIEISDAEVQKQYEARVAPQLQARADARAKAEAVLAEVRKDPSRFTELAKQHSDDPGSAAQGGDLGFFGRGAMVKPFENAVFKLKTDEISSLVETEFGFHIIQLNEVKGGKNEERRASHILFNAPAVANNPEAARKEIADELRRAQLARKFPETAEAFANLAYEQPDTLEPLVDRFGLKVQESGWLSRTAGRPPLDKPQVLDALFGSEAIEGKQNTEAVEVAPGALVVARVIDHKPQSTQPLADVREEIRKTLRERKALALARQAGQEKLEALRKGEKADANWNVPLKVSRENTGGLDQQALTAIFRTDAATLPAYTGIETAGGYAIYRINAVDTPKTVAEPRERAAANALAQLNAQQNLQGFVEALRERADVEVNEEQLLNAGRRGR